LYAGALGIPIQSRVSNLKSLAQVVLELLTPDATMDDMILNDL